MDPLTQQHHRATAKRTTRAQVTDFVTAMAPRAAGASLTNGAGLRLCGALFMPQSTGDRSAEVGRRIKFGGRVRDTALHADDRVVGGKTLWTGLADDLDEGGA